MFFLGSMMYSKTWTEAKAVFVGEILLSQEYKVKAIYKNNIS
jgi:hypothetical protein